MSKCGETSATVQVYSSFYVNSILNKSILKLNQADHKLSCAEMSDSCFHTIYHIVLKILRYLILFDNKHKLCLGIISSQQFYEARHHLVYMHL